MPQHSTLPTTTHGRYLVTPGAPRSPLLVGFHGYAETDEVQLERLAVIPGAGAWHLVSIQGLHRFYRGRGSDRMVVASWMTRQDRELAIADNLAYVQAVLTAVARDHGTDGPVVFAGFSQGVAMAFRAAALSAVDVGGIIALGGDVPPDLDDSSLGRIRRALVGRGAGDAHYSPEQWMADVDRLRGAGIEVLPVEFAGAHAWTSAFAEAAGAFLSRVRSPAA